jgi:hypothetical protein
MPELIAILAAYFFARLGIRKVILFYNQWASNKYLCNASIELQTLAESMLCMQGESSIEKMALNVHITPFIMHRAPSAQQIELQACVQFE